MIIENGTFKRSFANAVGRWSGIGPYYAMFPVEFAFEVIHQFSKPGAAVLDPFAGRATSIYAAATQNRSGLGIEINPVGWLYGRTKLHPANVDCVIARLKAITVEAEGSAEAAKELPEFFQLCYSPRVLSFLLAARTLLDWRHSNTDATLMAIILVYLHAKIGGGLSNQMRQTKSMAPDYSVRWWRERNLRPPDIDPHEFLTKRIRWRYAKGVPSTSRSEVTLGDSVDLMKDVVKDVKKGLQEPYSLLFTSPPYYNLTNYHYDQWLRLWMLGGPDQPTREETRHKGRFGSMEHYAALLNTVFEDASKVMSEDCIVYVRTDAREFTQATTRQILKKYFPSHKEKVVPRPVAGKTQTALFGDKEIKPGEIDIILSPRG